MAQNQSGDARQQNQPSHDAQVKGGQHSHSGQADKNQGQTNQQSGGPGTGSTHNQPSHEAQVKGGQHSHSGGSKQ